MSRFAKTWLAWMAGVLAALSFAAPAAATGGDRGQVTVRYTAGCDKTVTAVFTNTTRDDAKVRVTGHDGDITVPARTGGTPGTITVATTAGDDLKVQAEIKIGRAWVHLGECWTWKPPHRNCLQPLIDVTHPSCEHLIQTVTVSNPAGNLQPFAVVFDTDEAVQVAPGASADKSATVDITVTIDDGKPTVYPYTAPTGCPSPTPSASPSTSPATSASASPAPGAGGGSPHLPVTGARVGVLAAAGGALILAGGVLWLMLRRRRTEFVA